MLPDGILFILPAALAAVGLIYVTIKHTRQKKQDSYSRDRMDSVGILDMRYASGEINRDDYLKMRRSLEPPHRETA